MYRIELVGGRSGIKRYWNNERRSWTAFVEEGSLYALELAQLLQRDLNKTKPKGTKVEVARAATGARCDLCLDRVGAPQGMPLGLHAKCHLTAPLQASLEAGVIILR